MDVVNFNNAEIGRPEDVTAIGQNARAAMDAVQEGALGWPAHWARITVAKKEGTSDIVTVSPGEYHNSDKVYYGKETIELNLQTYKPVIASDERWIALILRGDPNAVINAVRSIETSEEPLTESIPVNQSLPKTLARRMSVVPQLGDIAPPPALRPAVNENDCCIAFVRLKTTGIQEIVANDADRVKTVAEIEGRLSNVEVSVLALADETQAIRTNVANIAAAVARQPDPRLFSQMVRDIERNKQRLNVPAEARNYYFDTALVGDFWDFTHAQSQFRVNEGLWPQYEKQFDQQLRLSNPANPAVKVWDGHLVLPDYDEIIRINVADNGGVKDIADVIHTTITPVLNRIKYERLRYGKTIEVCENAAGWGTIADRKPGEIFAVNGQEFVSAGLSDDPWNENPASLGGHQTYAARKVIRDTYYKSYTTYNTETAGVTGSVHAQTFLSAQVMFATAIDLKFERLGTTGDVHLMICEVGASGAPHLGKTIMLMTKPRSELNTGWCKFAFQPTLLEQGRRYAFIISTPGNHQIAMSTDFTGGTYFTSTDNAWFQGDTRIDIAFRLYTAKFKKNRTEVPMAGLSLDGGMTEVHMIYQALTTSVAQLVWEIRQDGGQDWTVLDSRPDNPLANLPPLVELRAVFLGTEDVAPGIYLDENSRAITGRMQANMQAVSKRLAFGFSSPAAQIVLNMDNFDDAHHTALPKIILDNGTVLDPVSVVDEVDPDKPSRTKFTANFTFGSNQTGVRLRIDTTTDDIKDVAFGQDVQLNAYGTT